MRSVSLTAGIPNKGVGTTLANLLCFIKTSSHHSNFRSTYFAQIGVQSNFIGWKFSKLIFFLEQSLNTCLYFRMHGEVLVNFKELIELEFKIT